MHLTIILFLSVFLGSCTGLPDGVKPVEDFNINRYLGTWYEIARLDHAFERGMNNISAEYTLRDDGGIKVINKGFLVEDKEWRQAEGRAYFVEEPNRGYLKVSFFGPFYGSYVIFELDKKNYHYAFVSGPDTSYLWLLARTPKVDREITNRFIKQASSLGFNTDQLIFVSHEPVNP